MPVIRVKVRPCARENLLEEREDGSYIANLTSPPVDGKANAELVALVAKHFGVARSAVTIKVGAGARVKLISIAVH